MTSAILLASFLSTSLPAVAAPLKITDVSASSELHDDSGVSYVVKNVKDHKQSTAWFESEVGSGLGSWVKLDLDGTQNVVGFRIWNGYWLTSDMWQRNNRVKELEVELADGTKHSFTLTDDMKVEELRFPSPVQTSSLKFRIKGIYKGSTFADTSISELQVFDSAPSSDVAVTSFSASSTYPADGDGDYEADNLGDDVLDSMWCEGNADGDGTGEWVQLDFGSSQRVSSLVINNGNDFGFKAFINANSATAGTLTFSDGSTQKVTIKPSMMGQTIAFLPRTTRTVRLTFDQVRKGKEFNDLCISELHFQP
ncbi:MAG: discoidin domain-containing protein [Oligoflexia bacterium]|nr:discoidin domain-containing protein [Oligoflexia bacterium]